MIEDPIKPESFYENEDEKIKLNWFCYEYAFTFYSKIKSNSKLKKYKKKYTQEQIADFCVYFSKAMKKSIFNKLSGLTAEIVIDDEYIYGFYPKSSLSQTESLSISACAAWKEQLSLCEVCPTRCISEMNEKCSMFNSIDDDGYLYYNFNDESILAEQLDQDLQSKLSIFENLSQFMDASTKEEMENRLLQSAIEKHELIIKELEAKLLLQEKIVELITKNIEINEEIAAIQSQLS